MRCSNMTHPGQVASLRNATNAARHCFISRPKCTICEFMKITKVTGNDAVASWYNTGVLYVTSVMQYNHWTLYKCSYSNKVYTYMSQMSHIIFNFKQSTSYDRKCNIFYNLFLSK